MASSADVQAIVDRMGLMQQQMVDMQSASTASQDALTAQLGLARDRVVTLEGNLTRLDQTNQLLVTERQESMNALRGIPAALDKLSKGNDKKLTLLDNRGLGKPYVLTDDDPDNRFRMWAIKFEDFVSGVLGEKWQEAMKWASEQEHPLHEAESGAASYRLDMAYGAHADPADHMDELDAYNNQMYSALRSTTEGTPFTYVDNAPQGNGLEAWRALHAKYDPSTGGRKKAMLNALIRPNRASYEGLSGAMERWRTLRTRFEQKKDQFGRRETLSESIAMNAIEQMVPTDLETHLLLNQSRFQTFDGYVSEIKKTCGSKVWWQG